MRKTVTRAVIATALALAFSGCCGKCGGGNSGNTGTSATADTVVLPDAKLAMTAPAGWRKYTDRDWTKFKAPDESAMLGLVQYKGDATPRIGEIALQFDLSEVKWSGSPSPSKFGAFNAKEARGSCKLRTGSPATIIYGMVETGAASQALLVYLAADNNPSAQTHLKSIQAAVASMRKQ